MSAQSLPCHRISPGRGPTRSMTRITIPPFIKECLKSLPPELQARRDAHRADARCHDGGGDPAAELQRHSNREFAHDGGLGRDPHHDRQHGRGDDTVDDRAPVERSNRVKAGEIGGYAGQRGDRYGGVECLRFEGTAGEAHGPFSGLADRVGWRSQPAPGWRAARCR